MQCINDENAGVLFAKQNISITFHTISWLLKIWLLVSHLMKRFLQNEYKRRLYLVQYVTLKLFGNLISIDFLNEDEEEQEASK